MAKSLLTVKTKKRKAILPRGLDSNHMGGEPVWDDIAFLSDVEIRSREMQAYNWYNYFYEPKEGRKHILEFMEESNMSKASVAMFNRLPDVHVSSSVTSMARMYLMGLADEDRKTKLEERILTMCRKSAALMKLEKKPSVASVARNTTNDMICVVEEALDKGTINMENFYTWLKEKEVKPAQAKAISEYYQPWLQELEEVLTTKDDDLKYAYRNMNKKQLKDRISFFKSMMSDCESMVSNNRKVVVRKTRLKKPKTADKVVSKIKFQKEHTDLKIVSIDPSKIVGASALWALNTKTNVLAHYVASDAKGLSVKGTTIIGYSDKSQQKKLRKPADSLSAITSSTAKAAERAFESLTTKASNTNGRINEQTILLRAIK
jgi:hypothetical protein